MKENFTAFWINVGAAPFAFQRLDGVYPHKGCAAPASLVVADERAMWLGKSNSGQGTFYAFRGYAPDRISTFAIEYQIGQYPTISDCIGMTYTMEGHVFFIWTFPTANATWVYDATASEIMKVPMWYQWGQFVGGVLTRWSPNWTTLFANEVIAGDCANGNIYRLDMDALTDNGAAKKCLRSWRHLAEDVESAAKCNFLDIECDTGLNVSANVNPQLVLRQSLDGGLSWSAEQYQTAGQTGVTNLDIRFSRLGATRRGLNNDRLFELSTTDQMRIGWLGASTG
jgi:hypothetical protein